MSIIAAPTDITNPFLGFVARLLLYTEIADPEARASEHGNLELHAYGRSLPRLISLLRFQIRDRRENLLLITLELLDSPHDHLLLRLVFCLTLPRREDPNISRVRWHWNFDHDIVAVVGLLKNRTQLD